jgi:hypothetical protein
MALLSEHIEYYGKPQIGSDRFAPLVKLRTVLLPFSSLCYKGSLVVFLFGSIVLITHVRRKRLCEVPSAWWLLFTNLITSLLTSLKEVSHG